MWKIFTHNSKYNKRARFVAMLWTLLIFILCLMPGNDVPEINIPLIDKWTHFVLFGGFAFLWLCGYPKRKPSFLIFIFILSLLVGSFIEYLQGAFPSLGRDRELLDVVADGIGGALGVLVFYLLSGAASRRIAQ